MNTTHFQTVSDTDLEQVAGGFGLDFFGPFPVVGFNSPSDVAFANGLIDQLVATFTQTGGPIGDLALGALASAKALVGLVKFS